MLLWEALRSQGKVDSSTVSDDAHAPARRIRLPFDHRCAAMTKSGKHCRGKILPGAEFCLFHDPATAEKRRERMASNPPRRNRLARLPDGYLRKLTSRAAVGQAMDRLYREVRLGVVTPEMGGVLFKLLTRLLDSGLCDKGTGEPRLSGRGRAEKLRPKLAEVLTAAERTAWRRAIAGAPPRLLYQAVQPEDPRPTATSAPVGDLAPAVSRMALQAS